MQRTIKFRAYDKEFEKMTYFEDEEYDYRPSSVFRLDQVFKKDVNYDDYEDFEYKDVTDKIEIMQYTGLKDKNGKEIYEEDIINYKDKITNKEDIFVVKYCEERAAFILSNKIYDEMTINVKNRIIVAEVIGNIYENKNLLEEKEQC